MAEQTFLVFDVESNGLHGEGFAVGWVVQRGPERLAEDIAVARLARPTAWVLGKVLPALPAPDHASAEAVRDTFWGAWWDWHRRGALLAADVAWPVEARFLAACIDDHRSERELDGPYPLIDIASVRLAVGLDPLATCARRPDELPEHNPLADARQSARLLMEALSRG